MKCPHCDDTGCLEKTLEGDLNCARCDMAATRAKLEEQLQLLAPHPGRTRDWAAYHLGRMVGATLALAAQQEKAHDQGDQGI